MKQTVTCSHSDEFKCVGCAPERWNPGAEAARNFTIDFLSSKIREAKVAYYNGSPIMRDEEYDALEKSLRAYDPNHEVLKLVGSEQNPKRSQT